MILGAGMLSSDTLYSISVGSYICVDRSLCIASYLGYQVLILTHYENATLLNRRVTLVSQLL